MAAKRERKFSELSFGQKCGLILVVFLLNTKVRTILLDQPEDHLDVAAVVFLLAPILEEFSVDHDFIVATHSVNLVMSLESAQVSALQIKDGRDIEVYTGLVADADIVERILDILEGGTHVFIRRLNLYSDFSERLKDQVESTDNLLQTSFRRRTIDELRNYIQPIVSDVEIMRLARHDLKQAIVDPTNPLMERL